MERSAHKLPRNGRSGEHELRVAFKTSSILTNPALFELIRHIARVAAESDYDSLLKSGRIPYSDPEHRG